MEEGETCPNLLSKASITLIPKSDNDITRRKSQANIPDENKLRSPKTLANQIQQYIKQSHIMTKWD